MLSCKVVSLKPVAFPRKVYSLGFRCNGNLQFQAKSGEKDQLGAQFIKISMSQNFGIPDPESANLTSLTQRQIICYLTQSENEYDGRLGARISSIFVIGIVSTAATLLPVLIKRNSRFRIPLYCYLFIRYFGSGVIIATAFIHLLDPAYEEIGPASCVGLTDGWSTFTWTPALVLTSVMSTFLMDFWIDWYVETKYGLSVGSPDIQYAVVNQSSHRKETVRNGPLQ